MARYARTVTDERKPARGGRSGSVGISGTSPGAAEHAKLFDAALSARASGRITDAARLFEQAQHYAEAAACWEEAGDLVRALESASRVPRDHALYASSARVAVTAARALKQASIEFDGFVEPWIKRGPRDTVDSEVLLSLGELYQSLGRTDEARAVYQRLLKSPFRADARARLDEIVFGKAQPAPRKSEPPRPPSLLDSADLALGTLAPGSVLAARYRLEEMLGQGGTATVFRATDLALEEEVALKLFTGPLDAENKARFRRELNVARKLAHEHILRIFELVLGQGVIGITMELVDGVTLDEFVEEGQCTLPERRDLLVQAVQAVAYAHRHGVIHRDIKPSNMLVSREAQLKVSDFGIAKACEDATITQSGSFHGTPFYVSPEQITSFKNVDHRADIYSLGVVAYELFTGRVPFEGHGLMEILIQHTKTEPPRPRDLVPELPRDLDALLLTLLEKSPDKRVQSCEELATKLSAIRLG
jgi:tetratricopeptide (TPR) repeat protein